MSSFLQRLEVPHPPGQPRPTWLLNNDIKPIEKARRTWSWYEYFSFWCVGAFNITNFQLGSALLATGLNWWQTTVATLIGHILAAVLIVITSFPGLEYHISFPVAMRISWGFYGSTFVVLNRILLSIVWFGVQSWQGGQMAYVCIRAIWPSIDRIPNTIPASTGMTLPMFVGFIIFSLIQIPFLILGPGRLRYMLHVGAIGGFICQLVLVSWAGGTKGSQGFGEILDSTNKLSGSNAGWMFLLGIGSTMSSITAGTLSIGDYTRFAKKPSDGIWSQAMGAFPVWLANVIGMLTIAATQKRFGSALWSVASLLMAIQDADPSSKTRVGIFFCAFVFGITQLVLNISGNSFCGGTDMSALFPKYINIRRGQALTAILGTVINPWYLLSGAIVFISVLSSYVVFLQPFVGIAAAHYFIIQKRRIKVPDLYITGNQSIYWYDFGVNWRTVLAWLVGVIPHLPGMVHSVNPKLPVTDGASHLYYIASITGFFIPFTVSIALDYLVPVKAQKDFIQSVSIREAQDIASEMAESNEKSADGAAHLNTDRESSVEHKIPETNSHSV
ncbi:allantoin permease [Nannizzia gypsea CBS 118893]|uniref:Allantoin permease n=1 Tax=Arthroderma gypseum (strain ATCC MYA-4604 / CBS 118893) TaxID=535722 RepID=E4V2T0_ARTGP|nr:allantoin permease [Nannizzia gypsea CBS 118893]EFR04304.1 allantoin permease [Nannizzia gypsea CBS 118893]